MCENSTTKSKRKLEEREKINLVLVAIREILIMPYIPIIGEITIKVGAAVYDKYYDKFITTLSDKERKNKTEEVKKILDKLYLIKENMKEIQSDLQDNVLFFKSTYWMLSILYKIYPEEFYNFSTEQFCRYAQNGGNEYFSDYNMITSNHIENRHIYVKDYMEKVLKLDISSYIDSVRENKKEFIYKKTASLKGMKCWNGIGKEQQFLTRKNKMKTTEIIDLIKQDRFIIRPEYQRTEVEDRKKASRIIESIILGVKLPPIYLYSRRSDDGLERYIVLDRSTKANKRIKIYGRANNR